MGPADGGPDILSSGLFDADHYAGQAGQTFSGPAEALAHYGDQGWPRGLSPSPLFDTRFYLRRNPDIRDAALNPLEHYVAAGRREGRRPRIGRGRLRERPTAPADARWKALAAARRSSSPVQDGPETVDVVIPAYRGFHDTLACIESVLTSDNRTPFRLTVIDDASPEAELSAALDRLHALHLIALVRNPINLGFVETANKGFGLSRRADVLLLNADTVVHGDWLDRMRAHAAAEGVATVTPLSNNATILSYPYAPGNNNTELELADAELDAIFAEVNAGRSADIPTGVGFCFYVTRAALDALGSFDTGFSPGYGEENDFCMRAQAAGWRNLAALDVYVRHTGETSFADPGGAKDAAAAKLAVRHPDYFPQVNAFMAADPLRPARQRVDVARAKRLGGGRAVLMVEHGWGGGVERHILELADRLRLENIQSFRLSPSQDALQLEVLGEFDLPNLPRPSLADPVELSRTLGELGLGHAHLHSLVAYPLDGFDALLSAIGAAGLAYDFTWHDYAPICPRITMVDWSGVYCASPSTAYCQVCVDKVGSRFGPVDVAEWRASYDRVLSGARRVFAPDTDVADRLAIYLPDLPIDVRPHPGLGTGLRPINPAPPVDGGIRTIGVLGRIGPFKGSGVLLGAALDALERDLPLRFRLWGATTREELKACRNVELMGEYLDDAELDARLAAAPPHLLFYPSVWPETFSYTLDAAFRTGLHPVCFDIGAPARRIRAARFGSVLPLRLALTPGELNERLLQTEADISGAPVLAVEASERCWTSADAYYAPFQAAP